MVAFVFGRFAAVAAAFRGVKLDCGRNVPEHLRVAGICDDECSLAAAAWEELVVVGGWGSGF